MAFPVSHGDRVDHSRFLSSREEAFPTFTSSLRAGIASQLQAHTPPSGDARAALTRRFTTNTVPTLPTLSALSALSPIGQARRQAAANPSDFASATYHKVQLLEKKRLEHEFLKGKRARFENEMALIDLQQRNQEDEINRLSNEVGRFGISGHQVIPRSEPTTPPEHRDPGFPSAFARPNRFSPASLQSPPGLQALATRPSRSGSQAASSAFNISSISMTHLPSKSVPGTRRNSDEEDDDEYEYQITNMNPRSGAALNRNSMPVTGLDLRRLTDSPDLVSMFTPIDTTGFLFGKDDGKPANSRNPAASPDSKSFLQMDTTNDKFPILVRREGDGLMQLAGTSAGIDLQISQAAAPEAQSNGWPSTFARHRQGQQSLPMNTLRQGGQEHGLGETDESGFSTPTKTAAGNRHSLDVKFDLFGETKRPGLATPPGGAANGMPKLQASYSTNDIPTIKKVNGFGPTAITPPKTHAEQYHHNHNVSMGRIPPNVVNNRHSRELSGGDVRLDEDKTYRSLHSALQANAPSFGPAVTSPTPNQGAHATAASSAVGQMPQFQTPAYYGGYGMSMLNMGMNNLQMSAQPQWAGQMHVYQNPYGQYPQPYQQHYGGPRFPDSQARVIQQRRMQNGEEQARFNQVSLESMRGEIHSLCKDQHGCRYLQKRLEDGKPEHLKMIFDETRDHVVELMTDPFGNYLCQKLFEYADDEMREYLILNAAENMVDVALNQHGTRALQKMIEFISTPAQIKTIIRALQDKVVRLIQDLNGNHVIQKCLNHLSAEDSQFIFDAVGAHCVIVGTHRHGCCVLQRCIDHASPSQKMQLVGQITENVFPLVQDPFGNYVVQYILDLNEEAFTLPLCHRFRGSIPALSKQKFSSNVIEKCIRVSDLATKRMMIEELLQPNELEKLVRDSFANYVIQTAMDYADPETRAHLVENMRPFLHTIRGTPYGRRIFGKIQDYEGRLSGSSSGQMTPQDVSSPVSATRTLSAAPYAARLPAYNAVSNGYGAIASPQTHRLSNPPFPAFQSTMNQGYAPLTQPQPNGRYP